MSRKNPGGPVAAPSETIDLCGRQLPLVRLTFNDLVQMEEAHGSVEALFQKVQAQQLAAIRYLVWLCLRKGSPDLTEETVGDLLPLHADTLAPVLERISSACGILPGSGGTASG